MKCNHCGKENKDGMNFCVHCGWPLTQAGPPANDNPWFNPASGTSPTNSGNRITPGAAGSSMNKKTIGLLVGGVAVVLLIVIMVFLDPLHLHKKKEITATNREKKPSHQGAFFKNMKKLLNKSAPSRGEEEIVFAGQQRGESQKEQSEPEKKSPAKTQAGESQPKQAPQQPAPKPPETTEGPLTLKEILCGSSWLMGPHYDGSFMHFVFKPDHTVEVTVAYRDFGQYDTANPPWDDPAWTKNLPVPWTYKIEEDALLLYMEGGVYWGRLTFVIGNSKIQAVYDENGTNFPFISDSDY